MPMYVRMLASTALFGLLLSGATALAQLPTKPVLTLEAAKKLAAAAEEEAVKNKWNMVIAIVDDGNRRLKRLSQGPPEGRRAT